MFRLAPLDCYPVISIADPAVDAEASDLDAYQETLDRSKLVLLSGEDPAVFWLRPLDTRGKARLTSLAAAGRPVVELVKAESDSADYDQAFRYAELTLQLTLDDRLDGFEVGGFPWKLERDDDGLVTVDSLRPFGPDLVFELASYAREASQLPLRDGPIGAG